MLRRFEALLAVSRNNEHTLEGVPFPEETKWSSNVKSERPIGRTRRWPKLTPLRAGLSFKSSSMALSSRSYIIIPLPPPPQKKLKFCKDFSPTV